MKRVLLTTALLAATLGTASAGSFKGAYAGVDLGWAWTKAKLQSTATATKRGFNQSGFASFAKVGYGEHVGSVYLGGEIKGGSVFSNKKNGNDKLTHQWNWGVAARVGGCIEHNVLGYFRLGLDNDQFKYKYSNGTSSKNLSAWSVVPGLGVDWMVAHNTFTTLAVDYGIPLSVSMPTGAKANTKPSSTTVRIGVGYQF